MRTATSIASALMLATTLTLTAGCSASSDQALDLTQVTAAEAAPASGDTLSPEEFAAAAAREATIVLDVRTPAEFAEGHLQDAVNLDVQAPDFAERAAALDPAGSYAVYCRSGNRSQVAMDALRSLGINGVYHLGGGIGAWESAGGVVVTG